VHQQAGAVSAGTNTFRVIPETVGSETGDDWLKNDASDKNPYEPQIAQWLREDPDLSAAEILRRVRIAGYPGGRCALRDRHAAEVASGHR
jgi:hypothetical protein